MNDGAAEPEALILSLLSTPCIPLAVAAAFLRVVRSGSAFPWLPRAEQIARAHTPWRLGRQSAQAPTILRILRSVYRSLCPQRTFDLLWWTTLSP